MQTVVNSQIQVEYRIYRIPVVDENMGSVLVLPALQAYRDSPHWHPVLCDNELVYVWPTTEISDVEAILVPNRSMTWTIYTATRSKKRPVIIIVKAAIPGNRLSNVFREPMVVSESRSDFVKRWILRRTRVLKDLGLEECQVEDVSVKCQLQEYTVLYSVYLHFNELTFAPTILRSSQ